MFFAAVAAAVLLLGAVLTAALAAYGARRLIIAYTDTVPAALPRVEMPAADYEALEKRIELFRTSFQQSKVLSEIALSADDINALIAGKSNPADRLGDKVRVSLEDGQVTLQMSLPLDEAGLPLPSGRYLNGSASFKVSMDSGVLIITADSARLNGKPLPEEFMAALRKENLARDIYRRPKSAELIRNIESINIKDGRISIRPRAAMP